MTVSFAWTCPVTGRVVIGSVPPDGAVAVECAADTDPSTICIAAGRLQFLPPRPYPWAVWDSVAEAWSDPRSQAEIAADTEAAWRALRAERDRRLSACDWTQLPDAPIDAVAWSTYRAELRDLPAKTVDPFNPVWPTIPAHR